MEHGLILDTNHFNQIGHWVYTCESLILDNLSIDLDLPRANEVNTHSVPWHKFDFSCGKVSIATTRQLERLTGVTHKSVTEVAKVRKIEPTLNGAVEAVSTTVSKN
jgi:hypothetical protein